MKSFGPAGVLDGTEERDEGTRQIDERKQLPSKEVANAPPAHQLLKIMREYDNTS